SRYAGQVLHLRGDRVRLAAEEPRQLWYGVGELPVPTACPNVGDEPDGAGQERLDRKMVDPSLSRGRSRGQVGAGRDLPPLLLRLDDGEVEVGGQGPADSLRHRAGPVKAGVPWPPPPPRTTITPCPLPSTRTPAPRPSASRASPSCGRSPASTAGSSPRRGSRRSAACSTVRTRSAPGSTSPPSRCATGTTAGPRPTTSRATAASRC